MRKLVLEAFNKEDIIEERVTNFYYKVSLESQLQLLHHNWREIQWRQAEAYLEPSRTSTMEVFAKTVSGF